MTHVFISYSKKNRAYARKLADHLLSLGFDVWIDDQIDFGEMWERTIFKAIDDCSAFLVIMTPESYASDWVMREIQYADRRHKPQFPVLLDGEDFPRYGPHQHVDVRGGILPPEDFYERLEKSAPRKAKTGTNVSPQDVAVPKTDTLPATPAATIAGQPRKLNTRVIAALSVGVFVLLVVGLVLLNRSSKTEEQVQTLVVETATLRQEIAQLSAGLTAEATKQVVTVAIPTPTLEGGGAGQIAFSSERSGNSEIYAMNADGSKLRRLTSNSIADNSPSWSPDGRQIAFSSMRNGNREIYVMNVDGSDLHNLTNNTAEDISPSWSPDGRQIAFSSMRSGDYEIYVMNADGSNPRNLTHNNSEDALPVWSPDSRFISFYSKRDGNVEIYVMNTDGSNPRNLTRNISEDYGATWSPDSTHIAFISNRSGFPEIYVMNADGSNSRNLTRNNSDNYAPSWSPDGSRIAFISNRSGSFEIYMMNIDGSDSHNVSNSRSNNFDPSWRSAAPTPDPLLNVPLLENVESATTTS